MKNGLETRDDQANRDPITGAPGAHPIGTGVGAAAGGVATGAAIGTVAGPVGTVIGAASRNSGRTFEEAEPEMSRQWNDRSGASTLRWESARNAARDAWNRINGPV